MTAPPGTPGEYVTAPAVPDPTVIGNPAITGPIGLGFRVPMLILSPFSRGGLCRRTSSITLPCWIFGDWIRCRGAELDCLAARNGRRSNQCPQFPKAGPVDSESTGYTPWCLAGDPAVCREPGWHNTLHSSEHADKSDAGIRDCDASERGVLVRATVLGLVGSIASATPRGRGEGHPSLDGSGAWNRLLPHVRDTAATGAMN